jgi:uncharacterized Zn finger protein
MNWWNYAPKPSVREQRARAAREAKRLAQQHAKDGRIPQPVLIEGRTIARSFWGKAWCENLEAYRDYEYRLPRGRTYVRNGAVLDLAITPGRIHAVVSGSTLYQVDISIQALPQARWTALKRECAGQIGSLIELLEGRLSESVLRIVTHREQGLFPRPGQIELRCSCPDWAKMCKHVAAVMYGVGARLDCEPELFFTLRQVDHAELITQAADLEVARGSDRQRIAAADLAGVFGIEIAGAQPPDPPAPPRRTVRKAAGTTTRKARAKKPPRPAKATQKTQKAARTQVNRAAPRARTGGRTPAVRAVRGKAARRTR